MCSAMPRRHQKGDVPVPTFIASGSGRDLYLDPNTATSAPPPAPAPLQYTDIETGERCTLRWWTRLPVAGEYKHRLKRQKAMAERLSQLPPLDKTVDKAKRSHSSLGFSTTGRGLERYDRMALEKFNPWSPHQVSIRNYALTYGMQKKPNRFDKSAMLAGGGFTDVLT